MKTFYTKHMLGLHERVYAKPMRRIANKEGPRARPPPLRGGPACPQDGDSESSFTEGTRPKAADSSWAPEQQGSALPSGLSAQLLWGFCSVCPERTLAFAERSQAAILDHWVTRTSNIETQLRGLWLLHSAVRPGKVVAEAAEPPVALPWEGGWLLIKDTLPPMPADPVIPSLFTSTAAGHPASPIAVLKQGLVRFTSKMVWKILSEA